MGIASWKSHKPQVTWREILLSSSNQESKMMVLFMRKVPAVSPHLLGVIWVPVLFVRRGVLPGRTSSSNHFQQQCANKHFHRKRCQQHCADKKYLTQHQDTRTKKRYQVAWRVQCQ